MKPGAGKARLRLVLQDGAARAREALAAELFDLERLRAAMCERAALGFGFCVVTMPKPLDLRATAAAIGALAWLNGEGLRHHWAPRRPADALAEDEAAFDLVMLWGPDTSGGPGAARHEQP